MPVTTATYETASDSSSDTVEDSKQEEQPQQQEEEELNAVDPKKVLPLVQRLSFELDIKAPPEAEAPRAGLANRFLREGTTDISVSIDRSKVMEWNKVLSELVPLTDPQWSSVAYPFASLALQSMNESYTQKFVAPGEKGFFTIADLIEVIEQFEAVARVQPDEVWFDGPDAHHIAFSGMHWVGSDSDGGVQTFYVNWDS